MSIRHRTAAIVLALASWMTPATHAAASDSGVTLRMQIRAAYPSLSYVDRYRSAYPDEAQGTTAFWTTDAPAPDLDTVEGAVRAVAALEDQHVALTGANAGKAETLGALFRTATDGSMVAWRVFDAAPKAAGLRAGDRVLAIDGVPVRDWLQRASETTFGGNRRGREAEAALDIGLGTAVVHRVAHLGSAVTLRVQSGHALSRTITLHYQPVDGQRATAMAAAIERPDLPGVIRAHGLRIGTLRFGAFAPQYDPVFNAASDKADRPGAGEDDAMLAGYCAVVDRVVERFDAIARWSDVVVIDLRGNMGGFDREARLLAEALTAKDSVATYDWFASVHAGTSRLQEEKRDPPCRRANEHRPLVVLDDAGTRSGGEFMAAWLWSAGAIVTGEATMGAGGGYEFHSDAGIDLKDLGLRVRISENFTLFDPSGQLRGGERAEKELVEIVAADRFAPSRTRPFAFQAVGLRPDVSVATTWADLRDGGAAMVVRTIEALRRRHMLP